MEVPTDYDAYAYWLLLAVSDRDEELAVQHAHESVHDLPSELEQDVRRAARGEYDQDALRRAYFRSLPEKKNDLPDYQREDWSPK